MLLLCYEFCSCIKILHFVAQKNFSLHFERIIKSVFKRIFNNEIVIWKGNLVKNYKASDMQVNNRHVTPYRGVTLIHSKSFRAKFPSSYSAKTHAWIKNFIFAVFISGTIRVHSATETKLYYCSSFLL